LANREGAKLVTTASSGDKKSGGNRFDLPDGCYCFYAKSVAACQRMMPTIDGLRRQGFPIVKVDIEAKSDLSKYYAIKAIPTILIKRGPQVVKLTGAQEERSLRSTLLQHHVRDEDSRIAKGNDAEPLILLAYPVGDLLRESEPGTGGMPAAKPDFDPLLHLIVSLIEPESWEETGGRGRIRPIDITQSLIVRQTLVVHAQIRIGLDELRKLQIETPDEKP
jgi:thiol-disulfide isomerase/thioredoxin